MQEPDDRRFRRLGAKHYTGQTIYPLMNVSRLYAARGCLAANRIERMKAKKKKEHQRRSINKITI